MSQYTTKDLYDHNYSTVVYYITSVNLNDESSVSIKYVLLNLQVYALLFDRL